MSNSNNHTSSSRGISFTGALQIAFIVLKLCEVIDWSWWWVFAPTWIGVALLALVILVFCIVQLVKVLRR